MQLIPAAQKELNLKKNSISRRRIQDRFVIALFLLPALVLFSLFVIYPIFRSLYFSTFNWKGFGPAVDYIGIDNYRKILTDEVFLKAIKNVLLIIVLSLGIQLPLALILAVLVGRDLPGRSLFRTVFFLPYVLSEVNTAIMWMLLYNPDPERGILNAIMVMFGLEPIAWLADMKIVIFAIFVTLTWKYFGFHMLLYLTGLQNIPKEIEEAARIDGANSIQNFLFITLPLLGSTIKTSVYMSVLGSIQQFILVWVMTKGGPVNASETMATYMYRFGFVRFQLGYGSAVAIIMFILCMIFSLIYQALTRKPDYLTGL
ncbi:carbohydrate ABC transporter permease [Pelolinea submarina]|uniref:Raffinose/stachyose/melibiose transport system permease protein n=1 Tax=Pelolinea submarina TaxID=913107 RepID=A0A347ZTP1_9CHLR|nr:sugar ABC transporter permease [Pelolinea submarina]REG10748.1 raffinose/stachyose/melibiose transport system permease protein [Pelolinea submarina]BBB48672.1 raffinose/stachyose/melibiose transport system permease protein [Pelolinea submarina]